ncbi:MAG: AtpZ/AtpI family protein [Candidatus Gracilibacteria bacterium]|nr:AtpZ/AtpI family protein [bacterium]MDZ4217308.1 AtpZ/AtpI family protein [Candidatus Gracilibacteria bacterium]
MKHEQDPHHSPVDPDPIRRRMDSEGKKAYDLMFSKHYLLTATVFGYVIGGLVIFAGGGYLLDRYLGTRPVLLIVGFVLSFIFTQYSIYKKFSTLQ